MKIGGLFLTGVILTGTSIGSNAQTNTFPSTGNVGIGTTQPGEKFEVYNGNVIISNDTDPATLVLYGDRGNSGDQGTVDNRISFQTDNNPNEGWNIDNLNYTKAGQMQFIYRNAADAVNTNALTLGDGSVPGQGYVGIGTATPVASLDVRNLTRLGNASGDIIELTRFTGSVTNKCQIRMQLRRFANGSDWTTASTRLQCVTDATNQGYMEFNPQGSSAGITIGSGNSEIIRFKSNGNVLIGKTSQATGYKLDIAGNVRADKIVVNTTGADFVFDSSYKLMPLNEVADFISSHRHLPEIAPASDMQTKGIDLGDNQTKLLQKIEELTLYLIEQNKQLVTQNKKIQQLTADNNDLKQQLNQIEEMKTLMVHQQAAIEQLQNESKQTQTDNK